MNNLFRCLHFSSALLLIVLSGYTSAQEEAAVFPKWKFSELTIDVGVQSDHYPSMSLEEMMAFARDPEQMERDLQGLQEDARTITAGGIIFFQFGLNPRLRNGLGMNENRQFQVGLAFHTPKEAMLSYKNEDIDTSIVYCNLQSEINFDLSYVFKGRWGKRDKWKWYAGIGSNLGITYNNAMILISGKYFGPDEHPSEQEASEQNMETYDANQVYYLRAYVPYGIHYLLGNDRSSIGLDFRLGIGVQMIEGQDSNPISKTNAFMIGYKYILGR